MLPPRESTWDIVAQVVTPVTLTMGGTLVIGTVIGTGIITVATVTAATKTATPMAGTTGTGVTVVAPRRLVVAATPPSIVAGGVILAAPLGAVALHGPGTMMLLPLPPPLRRLLKRLDGKAYVCLIGLRIVKGNGQKVNQGKKKSWSFPQVSPSNFHFYNHEDPAVQ